MEKTINNIVSDIINNPNYKDLIGLQDEKVCADISIFLEDELNKLSKVEIQQMGLLVSGSQNIDTQIGPNKIEKRKLCSKVAVFYVRIFNIIAAVLTAIDGKNNFCLVRLNALFDVIDDDRGRVKVCDNNPDLNPTTFLKIGGMEELLRLYNTYKGDLDEEKQEIEEKKNAIKKLKTDLEAIFKGTSSNSLTNNNTDTNENVMVGRISNRLKLVESSFENIKGKVNKLIGNNAGNKQGNNAGNEQGNKQGNNAENNAGNNAENNADNNAENNAGNNAGNNAENNAGNNAGNEKGNNAENNVANINNNNNNNNNKKPINLKNIANGNNQIEKQNGGTKKRYRKNSKSKSKKQKKTNKKRRTKQKGGMNIFKKLFGRKEKKPSDSVLEERTSDRKDDKTVTDLKKLVDTGNSRIRDSIENTSPIISSVPKNISREAICKGGKLNRIIQKSNSKFKGFFKKYGEFEKHYSTSSNDLLTFLQSNVLTQEKNGRYLIKKFNITQLNTIEKELREKLFTYYTTCHQLFKDSLAELVSAVGEELGMLNQIADTNSVNNNTSINNNTSRNENENNNTGNNNND
jgi:hypothetical protein